MTADALRVGRVLHGTTAEGPGLRSAIWFQGCSIQCRGCINPHLFSERGGTTLTIDSVISDAADAGVEGFTLIGGSHSIRPAQAEHWLMQPRLEGLESLSSQGMSMSH